MTRELSSRLGLEQEILRLKELLKIVEDEKVHASQDAIRAANAALMLVKKTRLRSSLPDV